MSCSQIVSRSHRLASRENVSPNTTGNSKAITTDALSLLTALASADPYKALEHLPACSCPSSACSSSSSSVNGPHVTLLNYASANGPHSAEARTSLQQISAVINRPCALQALESLASDITSPLSSPLPPKQRLQPSKLAFPRSATSDKTAHAAYLQQLAGSPASDMSLQLNPAIPVLGQQTIKQQVDSATGRAQQCLDGEACGNSRLDAAHLPSRTAATAQLPLCSGTAASSSAPAQSAPSLRQVCDLSLSSAPSWVSCCSHAV